MDPTATPPVDTGRPKTKRGIKLAQLALILTRAQVATVARFAPKPASKILMRRLLFSPTRTQASTRARRSLDHASTEVEVVDGNKIVHYIWGDGDRRVLLVHGWSGNAGQVTSLADALVAAGCKVVAVDLPGHGRSEGRQSSVVHFAKAIDAANRRYGPFRVVVAHSLGAAAATYSLSRELRCERAVFFNPVGSYESVWRRSEELLQVSPNLMALAAQHAEQWLGISFDDIEPAALAPSLGSKLLVIHDKYDREAPISDSKALVGSWPDAQLIEVQKLGHSRILSDDGMVRRVVEFATAVDGSPNP
jgi:pimeloyl-ACP methyl ester carboxylesterase